MSLADPRLAGRVASRRLAWPSWSGWAWTAIGLTAGFVALTCWWLVVDRTVQYGDAGQDLYFVALYRDYLAHGDIARIVDYPNVYPPATFVLGALAMLVGGRGVGAPVLAQNLVYVPLLALACFRTGRLLAGAKAGVLAVAFALGAPLLIEQFHVFMLDAPQAALVAATVWLVLESERFRRVGLAALAGVALGIGLETKELTPVYLAAFCAAVLARDGGWRNWRGIAAFAGAAFVTGAPWYLHHLDWLDTLFGAAEAGGYVPPAASPPTFSLDNGLWYGWATLNGLLFAPLFAFAAVGTLLAAVRVVRDRAHEDPTLELLIGLTGAWILITLMPHHDMRYTMPLTIFLATLGTAWIVRLRAPAQAAAVCLLVAAIVLAHLGATFGVGGTTDRRLPGNRVATLGEGVPPRDRPIVYSNHDFLVSSPHGEGDVLALFRALRRDGLDAVYFTDEVDEYGEASPIFERIGLLAFATIAGLDSDIRREAFGQLNDRQAVAIRAPSLDQAPPCVRLSDGSGVWIRRGDPALPGARDYCPFRQPAVYGP